MEEHLAQKLVCRFSSGGWARKLAMVDATKTIACLIAPTACEKNIFHLFRSTQPVKHYSYYFMTPSLLEH